MRENIKIYDLKYDFSHKGKYRKIELYTRKKNIQNIDYPIYIKKILIYYNY